MKKLIIATIALLIITGVNSISFAQEGEVIRSNSRIVPLKVTCPTHNADPVDGTPTTILEDLETIHVVGIEAAASDIYIPLGSFDAVGMEGMEINFDVTVPGDGSYRFRASAEDTVGNKSTWSLLSEKTWVVDTVSPMPPCVCP